jgi:type I restriction enzyme M protein
MLGMSRSADLQFDVVIANPPFGHGHALPQSISSVGELAFLELSIAMLSPNGRCAIIVPDGILFRAERPFRRVRERLLTEFAVIGVVRLPASTFPSAPHVRTNILFFERDAAQPDTIRYYQMQLAGDSRTRPALSDDTLSGALAWIRDGVPDLYSWEVDVADVKREDWSLDIAWPGASDMYTTAAAEQLSLFPDARASSGANTDTCLLAPWVEERGERAGAIEIDRFLGVSKNGFAPVKDKPAANTRDYRRVSAGDIAYNPTRIDSRAIALCERTADAGWVSPSYVVFRVRDDAPFTSSDLLGYLKSPSGRAEAKRYSHGSVQRRLRFKDLGQIRLPLQACADTARTGSR